MGKSTEGRLVNTTTCLWSARLPGHRGDPLAVGTGSSPGPRSPRERPCESTEAPRGRPSRDRSMRALPWAVCSVGDAWQRTARRPPVPTLRGTQQTRRGWHGARCSEARPSGHAELGRRWCRCRREVMVASATRPCSDRGRDFERARRPSGRRTRSSLSRTSFPPETGESYMSVSNEVAAVER